MHHFVNFHKSQLRLRKEERKKWDVMSQKSRFWIEEFGEKNKEIVLGLIASVPEYQEGQ